MHGGPKVRLQLTHRYFTFTRHLLTYIIFTYWTSYIEYLLSQVLIDLPTIHISVKETLTHSTTQIPTSINFSECIRNVVFQFIHCVGISLSKHVLDHTQ